MLFKIDLFRGLHTHIDETGYTPIGTLAKMDSSGLSAMIAHWNDELHTALACNTIDPSVREEQDLEKEEEEDT